VNFFHKNEGWETKQFDESAIAVFQEHPWHGNVIELKNVVERVLIMAAGPLIKADDLPGFIYSEADSSDAGGQHENGRITFKGARAQFEKEFIMQKLLEHSWDLDSAAIDIELERTSFHRKLIQYNIKPPEKI